MTDYKSMYYHLAGRMATAIDVLESTNKALQGTTKALETTNSSLNDIKERLMLAQQITEEMFMQGDDNVAE